MQATLTRKYPSLGGSYYHTAETWREYLAVEIGEHEMEGHPTGHAASIAMNVVPEDFPNLEPWQVVCQLIVGCTCQYPDFIIQPFTLSDNEIGFVPVTKTGMRLCAEFCGPGAVGFKVERQAMHRFIDRITDNSAFIAFGKE